MAFENVKLCGNKENWQWYSQLEIKSDPQIIQLSKLNILGINFAHLVPDIFTSPVNFVWVLCV